MFKKRSCIYCWLKTVIKLLHATYKKKTDIVMLLSILLTFLVAQSKCISCIIIDWLNDTKISPLTKLSFFVIKRPHSIPPEWNCKHCTARPKQKSKREYSLPGYTKRRCLPLLWTLSSLNIWLKIPFNPCFFDYDLQYLP